MTAPSDQATATTAGSGADIGADLGQRLLRDGVEGRHVPAVRPGFRARVGLGTTVQVAISGGSLDSGGTTLTLRKGKKLTLENTVDSARYVLLLVSNR